MKVLLFHFLYIANVCGREACTTCMNWETSVKERQCSYVVVVANIEEWYALEIVSLVSPTNGGLFLFAISMCNSVMPPTETNYTSATTTDCGLCSCTYEARNVRVLKVSRFLECHHH